ncbi:MAG: ZIP family metal transporter [Hyphomonadaceae bacterium]|nr:ZIP family metal transporter [Clostridia bacterium]
MVWQVTLLGFIAGLTGTGLGGLLACFISKSSNRMMSFVLELSAGLMLSVVCFDLLPHAFELSGVGLTLIGMLVGIFSLLFFEKCLSQVRKNIQKSTASRLLRAGILMGIGIALHNFPEGLAVGSGFLATPQLGWSLLFVIVLHDVPEGLAMALPMKAGGMGSAKAAFYTLLSGVPMGVGALCGAVLGEISPAFIAVCLGFAGGAMLYIVCGDLIPESKSLHRGRFSTIGNMIGIILGILIALGVGT